LAGKSLQADEVRSSLNTTFFLAIDIGRIRKQIDTLCVEGTLVRLPSGALKISEQSHGEFEKTIEEAEQITTAAKKKFIETFTTFCPSVDPQEAWDSFNQDCLMPIVREAGARTYELISGSKLQLDRTVRFPEYLARYAADSRHAVRNAIIAYLDPTDTQVRSYILRHLNAYFLMEAANLGKKTVDSLVKVAEKPPSFNIFVDTNFLFSILALHDNPSNEAAGSLMQLIAHLPQGIKRQLYVLRSTLDEARGVLAASRDYLRNVILTTNLADAALGVELSGIAQRFVQASRRAGHPVNADDYFNPYIDGLVRVLRAKNIELFNQNLDDYRTKQEVIDSLLSQLEYEKQRHGDKARTYEQLLHDLVLWYFVRDKRPPDGESPLEASYWVVTVDYHFLGFDAAKRRGTTKQVPICVHPTALIQMLQFWLPRTAEFEEAVLGSLRWPFLFQDFDPRAEHVTIRILEALSRFENVGDLTADVVAGVLVDDALRGKLSFENDLQKRVEIVKEALLKQTEKIQSQLAEENTQIKARLRTAEQEGGKLTSLKEKQAARIAELDNRHEAQQAALNAANEHLKIEINLRTQVERRVTELEKMVSELEVSRRRTRKAGALIFKCVLALALAGLIPFGLARSSLTWATWKIDLGTAALALLAWTWWAGRLISRCSEIQTLSVVRNFLRLRKVLFTLLGTVLLGVCGNAVWELIKSIKQ
jgi:hypothetical protein